VKPFPGGNFSWEKEVSPRTPLQENRFAKSPLRVIASPPVSRFARLFRRARQSRIRDGLTEVIAALEDSLAMTEQDVPDLSRLNQGLPLKQRGRCGLAIPQPHREEDA
jgi:hypothetical protein